MPKGTLDVIEALGFSEQWVFEFQIEMAVTWLQREIKSIKTRELLYDHPQFWYWFLADWGAIDDVIMLSMKKDVLGEVEISNGYGQVIYLSLGEDMQRYYKSKHSEFYIGKNLVDAPLEVRKEMFNNLYKV